MRPDFSVFSYWREITQAIGLRDNGPMILFSRSDALRCAHIAYDAGVVLNTDFPKSGIARHWDREAKVRDLA